jgi:hypothetical protein
MPRQTILKISIYALVVILSLAALWLVLLSPAGIFNTSEVYQGF